MDPDNSCEKCVCSKEETDLDLERQPLDMNILVNEPLNVEYIDVEIPIFDPTINVNEELELELELDLDLEKVMTDIEHTANFNSVEEGLNALNNPDTIFTRLQNAFNTFKEAVGRQMTYSEMRQMMG
jgi:hypothetical protein